jgi:hypothetical protein
MRAFPVPGIAIVFKRKTDEIQGEFSFALNNQ